jgi:hypothetical protein
VIVQIGTDTPNVEHAAIRIFNEKRAAAGKPEVDGTPCIVHREMLPFKIFDEQLSLDVPHWAALRDLPRIFDRSSVQYLAENGSRKTVIGFRWHHPVAWPLGDPARHLPAGARNRRVQR